MQVATSDQRLTAIDISVGNVERETPLPQLSYSLLQFLAVLWDREGKPRRFGRRNDGLRGSSRPRAVRKYETESRNEGSTGPDIPKGNRAVGEPFRFLGSNRTSPVIELNTCAVVKANRFGTLRVIEHAHGYISQNGA